MTGKRASARACSHCAVATSFRDRTCHQDGRRTEPGRRSAAPCSPSCVPSPGCSRGPRARWEASAGCYGTRALRTAAHLRRHPSGSRHGAAPSLRPEWGTQCAAAFPVSRRRGDQKVSVSCPLHTLVMSPHDWVAMVIDLLLIALAITLDPLPIMAFVLVVASDRGVWKGLAFILAWLACLVAVIALVLALTGGQPRRQDLRRPRRGSRPNSPSASCSCSTANTGDGGSDRLMGRSPDPPASRPARLARLASRLTRPPVPGRPPP